jgi:Diguanylate cyclase, GGDEF domain
VLTDFCGAATAALRPDDLFGRLGGEDFASLLPDTSLDDGLAVAERIRSSFEATTLEVGANTLAATVSVGVAVDGPEPESRRHDQEQPIERSIVPRRMGAIVSSMVGGQRIIKRLISPPVARVDVLARWHRAAKPWRPSG